MNNFIDELDFEGCVLFKPDENKNKSITFPSLIYFKGYSSEYGKGSAVLADFDRVIEIWSDEKKPDKNMDYKKNQIKDFTGVEFSPEVLLLPNNWEDFMEYVYYFIESGELDIISMNFENKKEVRDDYIENFITILQNTKIINDSLEDIMGKENNLINVSLINSGKMLVFSVNLSKYIEMANMFQNENEKKFLWLIIDSALKVKLMKYFGNYNISPVSKGITGIFVDEFDSKELSKILLELKEEIKFKSEDITEKVKNNLNLLKYIDILTETEKKTSNEGSSSMWNLLETIVIDYMINSEKSFSSNIEKIGDLIKN